MPIRMIQIGKPVREIQLKELNRKFGCSLPQDYLSFLQEYNGGIPEPNEFAIPVTGGGSGVNEFLSAEVLLDEKHRLQNRMPASVWPIAYAEGGNYVCLACGPEHGIYFWDHELEEDEGEEASWANMFLLAGSFTDFWESLSKFDVGNVQLNPGQIKSVWVDPDFKPEF